MKTIHSISLLIHVLLFSSNLSAQSASVIEWSAVHHPAIQQIVGNPQIVQTVLGPAVCFDGASGVFLDTNPLAGLEQLTIEAIIRPDGDGKFAQRFMHLGEVNGERIMFETRVNPDKTWYFDAYTQLPDGKGVALIDEKRLHPTDRWYNVSLVIGPTQQTAYVDGVPQMTADFNFVPIGKGISSVGVRQNLVDYFKGTIYRIRITPKALNPDEFLKDHQKLNP
jgi:hypothetical protein